MSMRASVSHKADSRHWITGARQRPQVVSSSALWRPWAPLPLRPCLLPRRRIKLWWPPPGGPASKPHCVSVTTVTSKASGLAGVELRISKYKGKYEGRSRRLEALSGLADQSSLLLTEDSLGLAASGSYLFR
ncbi:hypothetical protein CPT_Spernnie_079 [Streptomyces phage Spernnie]|uniref:Uncharacterized protein n=1 Tax=Streptomyces phage Spernnie TaxID=2767588 RepID=A0A873WH72_9CAUD|nr:hypothetical protein KGG74_gp79 [Streptomyces phage Spernnie]QPB09683.1 hypothetical protein CPT_Spernnie_079 [Streptomyces phage Spernnie]